MKSGKGPYLLLGALTIILFFILGIRYGQRVEKTNKTVSYILSITPSQSPTSKPVTFATYTHKDCRVEFLYPSTLQLEKETSQTALFKEGKARKLILLCNGNSATTEAGLKQLKQSHPVTGKVIQLEVDKTLLPLIEQTLTFK